MLKCWSVGGLECWSVGVLKCWSVGLLKCSHLAPSGEGEGVGGPALH